jgi:Putative DNA-binding domain
MTGGNVRDYARDSLFREIVAFANAQGGTLVLGIDETKEKPPCAFKITPLPRIHDLASRMENAARACIEPVIPGLYIRGIETEPAGEGVLIFRVAPSPFGPHRVTTDGHAFIRRGASKVQMTMREIQDLTLDIARGADRVDALFAERAARFTDWLRHFSGERAGCRITGLPLGAFPGLPRFSTNLESKLAIKSRYRAAEGGNEFELPGPHFHDTRPIVRGMRRFAHNDEIRVDVLESGLIDFWNRREPVPTQSYPREDIHYNVTWLLGYYLSVIHLIDGVRSLAGVPDWEFAIEFALDGLIDLPGTGVGAVMLPAIKIARPLHTSTIQLPVKFPPIPYRNRSDRDAIINLFADDLGDAAGDRRDPRAVPPLRILD